jgi:cytochrome c biogenesis protein ResB
LHNSQIVSKIKSQSKIHFGPDIIHIGLLILITGCFVTAFGRPEDKYFDLKIGDTVKLSDDTELFLKDFQTLLYENSDRVKAWISSVDMKRNGNIINTANIKVNEPLRIDNMTIYQQSFDELHTLILQGIDGEEEIIKIHKNFETGEGLKYFETGDTLTFFCRN